MKHVVSVAGLLLASSLQAQTLVNPQTIALGAEPKAVRIADLDGDGANEVLFFTAYASDYSKAGTLHVVDVDAADALTVRGRLPISQTYIHDVALAIARGPGGVRLAIAGANKALWSVSWDGTHFATRPRTTTLDNLKLEALDLDGDGVDEIVSHSWSAGGAVFGINPDLSLTLRFNLPTTAAGYNDMTTGDFNSDGLEDVAIMSGQGWVPNVQVFLSSGTGGFLAPVSYTVASGNLTDGVAGGDVNGDGRDDLVLTNGGNSPTWIYVYTQDDAGGLVGPTQVSSHDIPHDVIIADFENDGVSEVVVEHHGWGKVGIYRTDASGVLPGEEFVSMSLDSWGEQILDAGDVDDDGCPDLAVARGQGGATLVRGRTCLPLSPDTTPEAFGFAARLGVLRDSVQVSEPAQIIGIEAPAPITIAGGEYSIDGGEFTAAAGVVSNAAMVRVRHAAASGFDTDSVTVLDVGGVVASFISTTEAADAIPDAFAFAALTDVGVNSTVSSNRITVAGINDAAPIQVQGGRYRINGGAPTSAAGTVLAGDLVAVEHTASSAFSTATATTLTIGGVSANFVSTTEARDVTPNAFAFATHSDVATGTPQTSIAVSIAGINDAADISIDGGSYSINGAAFTTVAGTVRSGDQVRVQHISASSAATSVQSTLSIGGVSGTFTSRTGSVDTTPAGFVFHDVLDARRGKQVTSAAVTVTEFNAPVAVSIAGAGASYAINSGAYTTAPGTIRPGDRVTLRLISSPVAYSTVSTTLTVGGISDAWDVKTGSK